MTKMSLYDFTQVFIPVCKWAGVTKPSSMTKTSLYDFTQVSIPVCKWAGVTGRFLLDAGTQSPYPQAYGNLEQYTSSSVATSPSSPVLFH